LGGISPTGKTKRVLLGSFSWGGPTIPAFREIIEGDRDVGGGKSGHYRVRDLGKGALRRKRQRKKSSLLLYTGHIIEKELLNTKRAGLFQGGLKRIGSLPERGPFYTRESGTG